MTGGAYDAAVAALSRIPGVRGALVVETETGVPVTAELSAGVEGGPLAALAALLFQRTAGAMRAGGLGGLATVQMEAAEGRLVVVQAGPVLVVALAEAEARLGVVRLEAEKAAAGLR